MRKRQKKKKKKKKKIRRVNATQIDECKGLTEQKRRPIQNKCTYRQYVQGKPILSRTRAGSRLAPGEHIGISFSDFTEEDQEAYRHVR